MATNMKISGSLTVGGGVKLSNITGGKVLVSDSNKNIKESSLSAEDLLKKPGTNTEGMSWEYEFSEDNDEWEKEEYPDGRTFTGTDTGEIFNAYNDNDVVASGEYSHAEGWSTIADGDYSHAENFSGEVLGNKSHGEGDSYRVNGDISHAEGSSVWVFGQSSHGEGANNIIHGSFSHAEGLKNTIYSWSSHVEGDSNIVGDETEQDSDSAKWSVHVEGVKNKIYTSYAHVEGSTNEVRDTATYSHTEGYNNITEGYATHIEGYAGMVKGDYSHVECRQNANYGASSHIEGELGVIGTQDKINQINGVHVEGSNCKAFANYAHVEGRLCQALENATASHAEGSGCVSGSVNQHVEGRYNIIDTNTQYVHIVGNGVSDDSRSNCYTLTPGGNGWYRGTCTATSHPTSSSIRFKENIRDIDRSEAEKIFQIEPKMFDYKEEYGGIKDQVGFIAEEVEKVFPSCVFKDADGNIESIDYSKFVPYIIILLQQYKERIEMLESKIS